MTNSFKVVKPIIPSTDSNTRSNIRAVLKLLIGDEDRRFEMPYDLQPDDLPLDMKAEGVVLAAIYWCNDQQIAPSQANVVAYLELDKRFETPRAFVDTLLRENIEDTKGLRSLASLVHEWLKERKLKAQGEAIAALAANTNLGYAEKWEAAFQMVAAVSPDGGFVYEAVEEDSFRAETRKRVRDVIELRRAKRTPGITLPFEAAKAYFPYFAWGETTLIVGREGSGKTSIGCLLGEWIADDPTLDCDVIHFALETPLHVLSMREFSRNSLIPYSAIQTGLIDPDSDRWKPVVDAWMQKGKQATNEHSYRRFFYSPDASVSDIAMAMIRSAETSRALGRKVAFIIDHLHSIDWEKTHGRMQEFDALRAITRILNATANKISTRVDNHLFILAQEGDSRGQMFGGKFAAKRAQYVFTIQRERFGESDREGNYPLASEDLPIIVPGTALTSSQKVSPQWEQVKGDLNKYRALDAMGNPRFWYRKGDEYTHKVNLRITKANDSRLGVINLRFEASMNKFTQDPDQVRELRAESLLPPEGV